MSEAGTAVTQSAVRERILEVAARMFYRQGITQTGVDTIIAAAGVSKMSLYRHFGSKDQLVAVTLERLDRRYHDWFVEQVERQASSPADRLLAMFDVLDHWFHSRGFHGCAFINAAVELCEPTHPANQWVLRHKRRDRDYVEALAVAAGLAHPRTCARQLMLLMEGAIITALVQEDLDAARDAKPIARALIEHACQAVEPR